MCKKEEEYTGGKNRVFEEKFGKENGKEAEKSGAVWEKNKFVFIFHCILALMLVTF